MKDLLTKIIDAHGGIDRWNSFSEGRSNDCVRW